MTGYIFQKICKLKDDCYFINETLMVAVIEKSCVDFNFRRLE